ncbi:hypothetical protein [Paenibacillus sp. RS8]|uniref:hypothetical protein n=1 Tax=Paenibacillus sp. RS8 TaxID=3242681 RepID=UPI0035BFA506
MAWNGDAIASLPTIAEILPDYSLYMLSTLTIAEIPPDYSLRKAQNAEIAH